MMLIAVAVVLINYHVNHFVQIHGHGIYWQFRGFFLCFLTFCASFILVKSDFRGMKDICNVGVQSVTLFQFGLGVYSTEHYWRMSNGHVHSQLYI